MEAMKHVLKSKHMLLLYIVLFGLTIWQMPTPTGVTPQAWQLFAIFVATIAGIILNPLPMGALALISIAVCVFTGSLTLEQCLGGFGTETVWLVLFAFFISLGFIKTGFGARCAYFFISKLGRSTLGLSYGLVLAEFVLSPLIPSVTARGGGIIFPIAQSLCKSYQDSEHHGVSSKTAGFIMKVCFQSNVITSSLFLTAMAANPLVIKLASDSQIDISWGLWALAAFLPGIVCLLLMPLVVYFLYTPTIKYSEDAPELARQKLAEMGRMSRKEIIMLLTFVILITLWIFGSTLGISATATALLGLSILFVTRTISLDDALADKGAWHTFLWFATLVMLSGFLSKLGLMSVFGEYIKTSLPQDNTLLAAAILCLVYFYIHYLFASATAHITVLFPTFLYVLISYGFPPVVCALTLGFLSILSGGITHFSLASAPIFFGANYLKTKTWWYLGFMTSAFYLIVWAIIAPIWWSIIGLL
ncbi:MAG: DASS family sodium-coupled anion symporter [Alphaproteobacteria bacterium]|jgi:DASS family divalent anion:Na+ symporter|nr:anion permease [Candidatus Jidaibacter sp.]